MKAIWNLTTEVFSNWSQINAPRLGASLAYYTVLSMAPLIVLAIGIAGLVFGREAVQGQIVWQIQDLVGRGGAEAIQAILKSAAQPASGVVATTIGLAMLLFGASGVFGELRDSLNAVWGVKPSSAGLLEIIRGRFFSFAMVLGVGFLLLVSLILSAVLVAIGHFFGQWLPMPAWVLNLTGITLSFVSITVLFALIYKVLPDIRIAWSDVWVGAAITSLLFSIGKFLIGLYLGQASVGSAYGAAGSLVVVLVWVYYSAQIFFLGAEFTHIFAHRHGSLAGKPDRRANPEKALFEPKPSHTEAA